MAPEEPPHRRRDLLAAAAGEGAPGHRVAGRQIPHGQERPLSTLQASRRMAQIRGPNGARPRPGQAVQNRKPAAAMRFPVAAQAPFQGGPRRPRQEIPQRGEPDVRPHRAQKIVQKLESLFVEDVDRTADAPIEPPFPEETQRLQAEAGPAFEVAGGDATAPTPAGEVAGSRQRRDGLPAVPFFVFQ